MAKRFVVAALSLAAGVSAKTPEQQHAEDELSKMIDFANRDPERFVKEVIHDSPLRAVVPSLEGDAIETIGDGTSLPTVTAHGMGDSCFESGFSGITSMIGQRTGSYATCVPTGGNIFTDTINGFFMNMDKSVEVFAAKIKADPKLAGGFNAIGFSQGNSLIRGYIQKYNDPPVNAFVSVHGTIAGVAGLPHCNPGKQGIMKGKLCDWVAAFLADFAYIPFFQNHLFQANYFRDPMRVHGSMYRSHSQLAAWNNEGAANNVTFKDNFVKTKKFVMVKALQDTMVYPNEAEHWGQFADGTYGVVEQMKDTPYYESDSFGLKTVAEQGKIVDETTDGDHLQFTREELFGWVDKYFVAKKETSLVV